MKIRNEQVDSLAAASRKQYCRRMACYLSESYPAELRRHAVRPGELESFVEQGLSTAQGYGVIYEADVDLYITCMAIFGPTFDRDAQCDWAGQILRRTDICGTEKMDLIEQHMLFQPGGPR